MYFVQKVSRDDKQSSVHFYTCLPRGSAHTFNVVQLV